MEVELVPGGLWNIIGSIVIIAFGVAVAMVKPRGRAQVWFAAFALSFGLGTGLSNVTVPEPAWLHQFAWALVLLAFAAAGPAVLGLSFNYAGRPDRASS